MTALHESGTLTTNLKRECVSLNPAEMGEHLAAAGKEQKLILPRNHRNKFGVGNRRVRATIDRQLSEKSMQSISSDNSKRLTAKIIETPASQARTSARKNFASDSTDFRSMGSTTSVGNNISREMTELTLSGGRGRTTAKSTCDLTRTSFFMKSSTSVPGLALSSSNIGPTEFDMMPAAVGCRKKPVPLKESAPIMFKTKTSGQETQTNSAGSCSLLSNVPSPQHDPRLPKVGVGARRLKASLDRQLSNKSIQGLTASNTKAEPTSAAIETPESQARHQDQKEISSVPTTSTANAVVCSFSSNAQQHHHEQRLHKFGVSSRRAKATLDRQLSSKSIQSLSDNKEPAAVSKTRITRSQSSGMWKNDSSGSLSDLATNAPSHKTGKQRLIKFGIGSRRIKAALDRQLSDRSIQSMETLTKELPTSAATTVIASSNSTPAIVASNGISQPSMPSPVNPSMTKVMKADEYSSKRLENNSISDDLPPSNIVYTSNLHDSCHSAVSMDDDFDFDFEGSLGSGHDDYSLYDFETSLTSNHVNNESEFIDDHYNESAVTAGARPNNNHRLSTIAVCGDFARGSRETERLQPSDNFELSGHSAAHNVDHDMMDEEEQLRMALEASENEAANWDLHNDDYEEQLRMAIEASEHESVLTTRTNINNDGENNIIDEDEQLRMALEASQNEVTNWNYDKNDYEEQLRLAMEASVEIDKQNQASNQTTRPCLVDRRDSSKLRLAIELSEISREKSMLRLQMEQKEEEMLLQLSQATSDQSLQRLKVESEKEDENFAMAINISRKSQRNGSDLPELLHLVETQEIEQSNAEFARKIAQLKKKTPPNQGRKRYYDKWNPTTK